MHALQHGIQNKRHIVKTKDTVSPLCSLTYAVSHHCRSTVVATHLRGDAHPWWCKKRSRMRLQPETRGHTVLFPNQKTALASLDNGNL